MQRAGLLHGISDGTVYGGRYTEYTYLYNCILIYGSSITQNVRKGDVDAFRLFLSTTFEVILLPFPAIITERQFLRSSNSSSSSSSWLRSSN